MCVYLQYSLCNEPLIELSNPGASGSIFYVTRDDEFIIKTVDHKEAEFLQKLLPGYYMVSVETWQGLIHGCLYLQPYILELTRLSCDVFRALCVCVCVLSSRHGAPGLTQAKKFKATHTKHMQNGRAHV